MSVSPSVLFMPVVPVPMDTLSSMSQLKNCLLLVSLRIPHGLHRCSCDFLQSRDPEDQLILSVIFVGSR